METRTLFQENPAAAGMEVSFEKCRYFDAEEEFRLSIRGLFVHLECVQFFEGH
jgi:uncharacterized protein (DUF1684 family)